MSEPKVKKYRVNVHYDAVITVEVETETEDEALELAEDKAECMSLNESEVVGVQSCVTDIQPL